MSVVQVFIILTCLLHLSWETPVHQGKNVGEIKKFLDKIVVINPGTFPYIVYIEVYTSPKDGYRPLGFCGGVIIRPNVVLTAAHCVDYESPIIWVWAGILDIKHEINKGQRVFVKELIMHENFLRFTGDDLALLWLNEPFRIIPKRVELAKLPEEKFNVQNKYGWIVGWGRTECGLGYTMLQKALVLGMSWDECQPYYNNVKLNQRNFCITSDDLRKSAHDSGDSGGPFIVNGMIVGIASFITIKNVTINGKIVEICDSTIPGVFIDVSQYNFWIKSNLVNPKLSSESLPSSYKLSQPSS